MLTFQELLTGAKTLNAAKLNVEVMEEEISLDELITEAGRKTAGAHKSRLRQRSASQSTPHNGNRTMTPTRLRDTELKNVKAQVIKAHACQHCNARITR